MDVREWPMILDSDGCDPLSPTSLRTNLMLNSPGRPANLGHRSKGARVTRSFIGITLAVISGAVLLAAEPRDLLVAIRHGDYAGVQRLLQSGAEVNAADEDGTT